MSNVSLQYMPADAEKQVAFYARVSSTNQDSPEYVKLIKYLIDHSHWSPFEMVHAVFEVETSRAIAAQILRHRSLSFQEFSQRYADVDAEFEIGIARRQAAKNRQSSTSDLESENVIWFDETQRALFDECAYQYQEALDRGVSREQARMLLPLATTTRMYMAGSIRSWIHYCQVRCTPETQEEHRVIALKIRDTLADQLPNIAQALGWEIP